MDPNANLEEQLELARRLLAWSERASDVPSTEEDITEYTADADRLAELVVALHEWISKGGYLPNAWPSKEPAQPEKEDYERDAAQDAVNLVENNLLDNILEYLKEESKEFNIPTFHDTDLDAALGVDLHEMAFEQCDSTMFGTAESVEVMEQLRDFLEMDQGVYENDDPEIALQARAWWTYMNAVNRYSIRLIMEIGDMFKQEEDTPNPILDALWDDQMRVVETAIREFLNEWSE